MCGVCSLKCKLILEQCLDAQLSDCDLFFFNRIVSVFFQFPNKSLLLAVFAACVGGTFQYGYNISVINSPTMVIITLILDHLQVDLSISQCEGRETIQQITGGKQEVQENLDSCLFLGIALSVQPLYLGEIAPTALRGAMGMGTSIFITGGILTGQVMGLKEVLGKREYWPILLSTTGIPAILQLLILPWFPESPRYLFIDKGDDEACKKALRQLHGAEDCHAALEDITKEKNNLAGFQAKKPWELFADRSLRWQLLTIILLNMAQQLNGINAIYFYADYVFKQSGIPDDKIPYATVGTGACECITGLLIEYLGRKVLITGGYFLMSICCILFTLTLTFQVVEQSQIFIMACVFAFILSFGLGPGGVTNILTTELFTQSSRPAAFIISGSVNWLSFFFIGLVFPFIIIGLQQYCFLVFLVVCSLVGLYIFLVVPETKNKTFVEIQNDFQSSKNVKLGNSDGAGTILLSTSI
uniref:Solute carrier family 2, facilitated glucose transporter member 5 n=1 Tax=Oryzias sinensis TaxID=183150 RepID=A0A8C8DZE7_9TELE